LEFQKCIISTLLGNYLLKGELFAVSKDQLILLNEKIAFSRRADRLVKGIWLDQEFAILLDDVFSCTSISEYDYIAVEIKPKWGFRDPYTKKCRFCVHDMLKNQTEARPRSLYCPLLLFSNDEEKIKQSLTALTKTPINNLKLYRNGHQVESIENGVYVDAICKILSTNEILSNISRNQSNFHDNIFELATMVEENPNMERLLRDVDDLITNPSKLLSSSPSANDIQYRLARFMVSLSLKDLSIVISLKPSDGDNFNTRISGIPYKSEIYILDCDPKSSRKIFSVLELEKRLMYFTCDCCCPDIDKAPQLNE
jgi:hypothetical protein